MHVFVYVVFIFILRYVKYPSSNCKFLATTNKFSEIQIYTEKQKKLTFFARGANFNIAILEVYAKIRILLNFKTYEQKVFSESFFFKMHETG